MSAHRMLLWSAALTVGGQLALAQPCDLYASGGTPCVAAHSTTRALYDGYNGGLYQVTRGDGATMDVGPLGAGGVANAGAQDAFCNGQTCSISIIYDQSGHYNDLYGAPGGGAAPNPDKLADATAAPVYLNGGQKAYGVLIPPGTGYRQDKTNGVPTGNDPQGIYAVLDGTHYNNGCCFDYGNAETSNDDTGNSHMEALYFGTAGDGGSGSGPWVQADLENGLFIDGTRGQSNPNAPTQNSRFVTGVLKGDSSNRWALRSGDATQGDLDTFWDGPRPDGYYPMNKEGAIILGIGGDNSDWAEGTFYEGAIVAGFPSDDIENDVQDNIIQWGYST